MIRPLSLTLALIPFAIGPLAHRGHAEPVYTAGHSDIGVDYLAGPPRFDLKIRFDGNAVFEDGSQLSFQRVAPESVSIRAPDPSVLRTHLVNDPEDPEDDTDLTGPEWDFLGTPVGEAFWFMPQINDPNKPFFGFATDNLTPSQWSGPMNWSLEEIVSAPAGGEFSLWQTPFSGNPKVLFASFGGIDSDDDSFTQPMFAHDHYNWGFSKPGVYEVRMGATATRVGVGQVHGSAVFTFLVGDAAGMPLDGDYNANGVVDSADYVIWRKTLGQTGTGLAADGDGDGSVGQGDYAFWRERFGMSQSTAGMATGSVPEPTALFLFLTAALSAAMRHRF